MKYSSPYIVTLFIILECNKVIHVWAILRQGEIVCKCERMNETEGKNNPAHIMHLDRIQQQPLSFMILPFKQCIPSNIKIKR